MTWDANSQAIDNISAMCAGGFCQMNICKLIVKTTGHNSTFIAPLIRSGATAQDEGLRSNRK